MKTFALAGNPNCGKTTLFNSLTGSTAHVGNWPGVTVDKKEGTYKKCKEPVSIIDLPGIYSLSPYTSEEVITRNYILEEKPDCVINVVDATNLERNLYLTTQLSEIDVPIVVALNMMDLVTKSGDKIDPVELSRRIGCPVVCISATKEDNLDKLMEEAYNASLTARKGKTILEDSALSHLISDVTKAFTAIEVENPLFHAVKLVENDELEVAAHKDLVKIVDEFKKGFNNEIFGNDLEAVVADARYQYISKNYSNAKIKNEKESKEKLTKSDKIDRVLTNKWAGIPIFLVILFMIFHLTFAENFLFLGGLFENVAPSFEGTAFEGLIWTDAGINSPGVILFNIVDMGLGAFQDVIAGWCSSIPSAAVQGLIVDGVVSGVFAVIGFIPQILLLFLFFSILEDSGYMARVAFILDRIFRKFGLSGRAFMPMFMGFGCSVPAMINCRTLSTDNEKTATIRVIPFFSCGAKLPILTAIAGGICQAFNFPNVDLITYSMYVLGVSVAILAVILMRNTVMRGKVAPFIMELPTYHAPKFKALMFHLWDKLKHYVKKAFTIILASTIVIWFLQSFTFDWKFIEAANPVDIANEAFDSLVADEQSFKDALTDLEFDLDDEELSLDAVLGAYDEEEDEEVLAKYEEVLKAVYVAAATEFVSITTDSTRDDYNPLNTGDSILAGVGKLFTPIFTPLGFGKQLNENGWVFPVAAGTGLIAKENVISTFAVLAQCTSSQNVAAALKSGDEDKIYEAYSSLFDSVSDEDGVIASTTMASTTGITDNSNGWAALIAFIVFNMTTIPCFAAVATAKGELPKKKFATTILFWLATSYIASMVTYLSLAYWWPIAIFVALGVGLGFAIHFINKYKDNKKIVEA